MNAADFTIIAGLYLAAFASGYVSGVMFRAVRRVIEAAAGVGS